MFTVLGDSITYGEGATRPAFAYPNVLAELLRVTRRAPREFGTILAHPGWTSGALRTAVLQSDPGILTQARPIIIWVGGDDLAYSALAALQERRAPMRVIKAGIIQYSVQLGAMIRYMHRVSRAPVYVCTQYNPFPNSEMAAGGIGALNDATTTVAAKIGANVIDSGSWFAGRQPELIAGYRTGTIQDALRGAPPIHPNNRGHRVIAEGLNSVITI